jgi:hypothetical protein
MSGKSQFGIRALAITLLLGITAIAAPTAKAAARFSRAEIDSAVAAARLTVPAPSCREFA